MSETAFLAFQSAFLAVSQLVYAACFTAFLVPFSAAGEHRRGKAVLLHHWGKAVLVFFAYLGGFALCDRAGVPQGLFGILLAVLLVLAAGPLGLERAMALLLAVLYWNTRISAGLMVESLYYLAEQRLPFDPMRLETVYLRAAVLITLFLVSHTVLMAAMLYALQRRMRRRPMPLCLREVGYLCIVPAAGILAGQMLSRLLIEFQDGVLLQLYERHPAFLATVPLLALLFYAGAYLAIVFWQGIAALREEQAAWFVERQQTRLLRARIHEAERSYARIRALQHEMRGHFANLKGLAQSGALAAIMEYIDKMGAGISGAGVGGAGVGGAGIGKAGTCEADVSGAGIGDAGACNAGVRDANIRDTSIRGAGILDAGICDTGIDDISICNTGICDAGTGGVGRMIQTGNPVSDVIVNDKRQQCEELGIRFEAELCYPGPEAYDAFDVGIILQNLLQNALEACENVPKARRYIRLTGKRTGRFFLIEVRNPFAGEVMFGPDGLPRTTKRENAPMHGLGLANVRREAEKYMGELELKAGPEEFIATVLLQERCAGAQNI